MTEQTFVIGIIGGTLSAALLNVIPALSVVLICIVVDFCTGIWAAMKNQEKIESHKMRKTVYKILAYLSVIVLCAFIDTAISPEWHLATFVAGFCSVNEVVSIIENWGKITHKDYLEKLKDFLSSRFQKNHHH